MSLSKNESVMAALEGFAVIPPVRQFISDVLAERALTTYDGVESTQYVAVHTTGSPVALYAHRTFVDVAVSAADAERLPVLTGVRVVGKASLPYVHVDVAHLEDAGHREHLLRGAIAGVDALAARSGRARPTSASSAGAGPVAAPCPDCFTVPAANGVCSC